MNIEVESKSDEERKATEEKEERWQSKIKSFMCGINHIYESKEFSDVEFTISGKIFNAHRLILGARSPVFARLLLKRNAPSKIIFKEVSEVGFDILLKYIYTERLETANHEEILEAYRTALQFEQKELLKECKTLIGEWEITYNNVCTILNQAAGILFLKARCLNFIRNNNEDIIASDDFLNLTTDSIKEMFQNNCLEKVSTMAVLRNVLRWCDKKLSHPEDYKIVRNYLMSTGILGRLKIHELSKEELIKLTAEYQNLLTPIEFQQFVLNNLSTSGEKTLPEWCIL